MKRILVLVEIEASGDSCGACPHRRALKFRVPGAPGMAGEQRVFAHACTLFGGFVREGRRVGDCLSAQVDYDDRAPAASREGRSAERLAS